VKEASTKNRWIALLVGDALVLAVMTVAGFASHDLLGPEGASGPRMLATFFPFFAAWLLIGPHLGVFDRTKVSDARQLWRPFWAMVLAAPLAAWLRGVWLGSPVLPVFVAVVGGLNAVALLVWRTLYLLVASRLS
jgi:hypothetical protein